MEIIQRRPKRDLGARLRPNHARHARLPVLRLRDPPPQPAGVVIEAVLVVDAPWDLHPASAPGDGESEHREAEKGRDEEEHDEEVEPERPGHVEAGADEAGERDDEHHEANH